MTIKKPHDLIILPINSINPYSISNCNFGMLFGMSFKKFSMTVLELSWSEERVQQFVMDRNLQDSVAAMKEKYPLIEAKLWSYYACADFIRDNFFEGYKGFMKRIKRNEDAGKLKGYVRTLCGAIRRFPLLSLATNEEGRWRKGENIKEMAGQVNTCANTDIQTLESFLMSCLMLKWRESDYYEKGKIIGDTHDSFDSIVEKEGAIETLAEMKKVMETEFEWQTGIKMPVDFVVCDLDPDAKTGHYYKNGWGYKEFVKKMGGGK